MQIDIKPLDKERFVKSNAEGRASPLDREVARHYDRYSFYINDDDVVMSRILTETPLGEFIQKGAFSEIKTIVDIGCGASAKNISFISKYKKDPRPFIIGTDGSYNSLSTAKGRLGRVPFLQADNKNLPFKDNSCDLIIATGTLHHMSEPEKGLLECLRILKCGKFLYLSLYNRNHLYYFVWRFAKLLRILRKFGLEVVLRYTLVPLYGVVYWCVNALSNRRLRKISFREMEMSFFDFLLVPIAHFFELKDVQAMIKDNASILNSKVFAEGIMLGVILKKYE